MSQNPDIEHILLQEGIRPTANRILVMRTLQSAEGICSLREIEDRIDTLDKSSVFRVLRLLADHHLVHEIDDGTGIIKYELCTDHRHDDDHHDDEHVHFYCERCQRTFCLSEIPVPHINLPDGFEQHSTNFVIHGICSRCRMVRSK